MSVIEQVIGQIQTMAGGADKVELDPESDLLERAVIDSSAVMDLVLWIEETFDVSVEPEALVPDHFGTPGRIAAYIESQQGDKA